MQIQSNIADRTHDCPQKRVYLNRADAAAYVGGRYGFPCSRQWLAKLAVVGGGPAFRKAGRYPIYDPAELDAWAAARIAGPFTSTSENMGPRE